MTLKEGEFFKLDDFQNSTKNIFRLGYFKTIEPEFEKIPEDENGVNVILNLDESKSGSFMGSISYSSDDGWLGKIGISDNNLFGRAQTLGINYSVAEDNKRTYDLSFSDPWVKGTNKVSLSTRLYRIDEEIKDDIYDKLNSYKTGFTVTAGKQLG